MKNAAIATPNAERDQRPDDAFPELVKVLQKRHLAGAGAAAFWIVVVKPAVGHGACGRVLRALRIGKANYRHTWWSGAGIHARRRALVRRGFAFGRRGRGGRYRRLAVIGA